MKLLNVNSKKNIRAFIILTFLPIILASIVSAIVRNYTSLYNNLNTPIKIPSIVFIIVWSILYLTMGYASYRIYMVRESGKNIGNSLFAYIVQLILNYLWVFIFFSFRLYGIAFCELIILISVVISTIVLFFKQDKIAAFLLIPYTVWLIFAAFLNFIIWMFNEMLG